MLTVAGTGLAGFDGDGGAATSASFSIFDGVAVDPTGNIYVVSEPLNQNPTPNPNEPFD